MRHQIRLPFQPREILGLDWLSTCACRFRAAIQLPSVRVRGTVCVSFSPQVCGRHVLCLDQPSLLSGGTVLAALTPPFCDCDGSRAMIRVPAGRRCSDPLARLSGCGDT